MQHGRVEPIPNGWTALLPAVALALRYATEQEMLPRPLGLAEVWEGLPAGLDRPGSSEGRVDPAIRHYRTTRPKRDDFITQP